ncbi:hypothetical protein [Actinomycetospora sp.]|jgi:hypothetical protein|uniref:hypothetical protein n=1 Tax=Actinomycetospora sp. TaxID=1872135 RepID=UPI002F3F3E78
MAKNKPVAAPRPSVGSEAVADARRDRPAASRTGADAEAPTAPSGLADRVGDAVVGTVRVVHTMLPSRFPAYLGGAALLVVGVIDTPALLAGGLAYEALRRWNPQPHSS